MQFCARELSFAIKPLQHFQKKTSPPAVKLVESSYNYIDVHFYFHCFFNWSCSLRRLPRSMFVSFQNSTFVFRLVFLLSNLFLLLNAYAYVLLKNSSLSIFFMLSMHIFRGCLRFLSFVFKNALQPPRVIFNHLMFNLYLMGTKKYIFHLK
jgi:hypothetical protein